MPDHESIVIKPREVFSDAILPQNADELAKFMDEPVTAIAEAITGALAAGPRAWTVMTGHIVQGMLKGKLFQQVGQEIKELRAKGKIPDDYAEKKYGFQSWVELLRIIDEEAPDEDKLDALKAMFYSVNKIGLSDTEKVLNYQLLQTAKRLKSSELLLLKAIHEAFERRDYKQDPNANTINLMDWAGKIARLQGHNLAALVLRDERVLVEEGLITPYLNPTDTGKHMQVVRESDARLTDLGMKFCENIRSYHRDVASDAA